MNFSRFIFLVDCGLFISTTVDLATPMKNINDIHIYNQCCRKQVQPLAVKRCVHNFIATAHSNDCMIAIYTILKDYNIYSHTKLQKKLQVFCFFIKALLPAGRNLAVQPTAT